MISNRLKTTVLASSVFVTIFGCVLMGFAAPAKNFYIQSLEKLLKEQAQADTVTAKIMVNPTHPNITNITSGYFLTEMLARLDQLPKSEEAAFKSWVKHNESWLPAPILMDLGAREFATNPTEGMKWSAIGRVRSAYDAQRCIDSEVSATPRYLLLERQLPLRGYAQSHPQEVIKSLEDAIQWDETHPYTASPIWMCAYSLKAIKFDKNKPLPVQVKDLIKPEASWPAIRQEVHAQLRNGLEKQKQSILAPK